MIDLGQREIVEDIALELKLDPDLITAIIMVESSGNPWAVRYEPTYKYTLPDNEIRVYAEAANCSFETLKMLQKCSFGPMQIMAAIAYDEYGFRGYPTELCDFEKGVYYGASHLKKFIGRYHLESDAISAYNAGSVRKKEGPTGFLYANERYVDEVSRHLRELRKID